MSTSPPTSPAPAAVRLTRRGRCLCGAVRLTARLFPERFGACHCGMCRRWSGGPLLSVDCGPDLAIDGEDSITRHASSSWAERAFCRHCGTHLFYRGFDDGRHYVPIGLLDGIDDLRLARQSYIDRQPPYYARLAEGTVDLTEAQMTALYAPQDSAGPGSSP